MSFELELSSLSKKQRYETLKRFSIQPKKTQYNTDPDKIRCFRANASEDSLVLPLGSWRSYLDEFPNDIKDFHRMGKNAKFNGKLLTIDTDPSKRGRDQDVVAKKALHRLEKEGSIFIASFTGFGKCLAPGTPVLMFDGTVKPVEDVYIGDKIMGDDSKCRNVLSVCTGYEQMYEIDPLEGKSFTVNESHILSLKSIFHGHIQKSGIDNLIEVYTVYIFDNDKYIIKSFTSLQDALKLSNILKKQTIDIEVKDFLKLPTKIQYTFECYWTNIDFKGKDVKMDPYKMGLWLGGIETVDVYKYYNYKPYGIPLDYKANSRKIRLELLSGLIEAHSLCTYEDNDNDTGLYTLSYTSMELANDVKDVCRSLGFACNMKRILNNYVVKFGINQVCDVRCERNLITSRKFIDNYDRKNPIHITTSFTIFKKQVGKYYGFEIDGNRRFLLGNYMVTHNTAMGVYLSLTLGLKTAVMCHFDTVRKQWPGEYEKFSKGGAVVQFVQGAKCKLDKNADVYIIGVQKASNMSPESFSDIGTVIIDESHVATVAAFSKTLLNFRPRYLIGLSATPDRPDGLHSLFTNYFGNSSEFIVRKETKEFTVYKINTPFKPEINLTVVKGRTVPNWNTVVNSIEENVKRHNLIANIAIKHKNEKVIILCNRNVLSEGVYKILKERGESVALLIGQKKSYDKSSRILVAGFKKGGVGLNDPNLTMAIIASDTKDVRQYEGRIRTTNNIIYHLVDNYRSFENHWKLCEKWYKSKGAVIKYLGDSTNSTSNDVVYNFL